MDELQISGKRFVSARRIARDHGYTSDYIGQLIRGGKITGQKVGRAWYVDAVTFDAYLGAEADAPTKVLQQKSPEQRSSDLLASQETPLGPVEARPFARDFSVSTLVEPVIEIKKEEPTAPLEKIPEPVIVIQKEEKPQHVPLRINVKEEPAEIKKETGGLRYYSDESPSLPEIRSDRKESRIEIPDSTETSSPAKVFPPAQTQRARPVRFVALAAAGLTVFIFCAVVSSALTLNLSIEAGNTATASYSLPW